MSPKKILITLLLLYAFSGVPAQTAEQRAHPDFPELVKQYQEHNRRFGAGDYEGAFNRAKKLLTLGRRIFGERHQVTATYYFYAGRAAMYHGSNQAALKYLKQALSLYQALFGKEHPAVASTHTYRGMAYRNLFRNKAALKEYRASLKINKKQGKTDTLAVAGDYGNIGSIYHAKGEYDRAIEYFKRALAVYKKKRKPGHYDFGGMYNSLGSSYKEKGDYKQAKLYMRKAVENYRASLGAEHYYTAVAANNLGNVYYSEGLYAQALPYYLATLKIYEKQLGRKHPHVAVAYNNVGTSYMGMGQQKQALKYYKKALTLYVNAHGAQHPYVATTYNNMAVSLQALEKYAPAISNLRKALQIFKQSSSMSDQILAYWNLADIYEKMGRNQQALKAYQNAIQVIMDNRLKLSREKSSFTARYGELFNKLIQLQIRMGANAGAFQTDSRKRGLAISENLSLKQALRNGNVPGAQSRKLLELENQISSLISRRAAAVNKKQREAARKFLEQLWTKEKQKENLEQALLKKYPAFALLRRPAAPNIKAISKSLRKGELLLSYSFLEKDTIAYSINRRGLQLHYLEKGRKGPSKLDYKIRNLHTLLAFPLENLKAAHIPEFVKIQTERGLLLWNPEDSKRYELHGKKVFLPLRGIRVKKKKGAPGKVSPDKKPDGLLGRVTGRLKGPAVLAYRRRLQRELYDDLLRNVLRKNPGARKLLIIPDGPVYYLPFGVLWDGKKLLLEKYPVKLAHSALVWHSLRKRQKQRFAYPLLAVGNAVYAKGHGKSAGDSAKRGGVKRSALLKRVAAGDLENISLDNLSGTLEEVSAISRLAYPARPRPEQHVLLGVNANLDQLLSKKQSQNLAQYRILHFAVHGLFIDGMPELNALVFSLPPVLKKHGAAGYKNYIRKHGALKRDGFLRLGEVRALELKAELVVLSACETSLGHSSPGEGMVGLPQGFLIAGADNVMASLWSVEDRATSRLMGEMYQGLFREKRKPAEALRRAQLKLRKRKEFRDPFFWSAFVVYGN